MIARKSTTNSYRRFLVSAMASAVAAGAAGLAHAQQNQAQPADGIEEISITGSFINRAADRPQPVIVMGQQDIQANQRISLGEFMRDMPQVTTVNTNGTNGGVLRSATGSNSINIRGLGDRST